MCIFLLIIKIFLKELIDSVDIVVIRWFKRQVIPGIKDYAVEAGDSARRVSKLAISGNREIRVGEHYVEIVEEHTKIFSDYKKTIQREESDSEHSKKSVFEIMQRIDQLYRKYEKDSIKIKEIWKTLETIKKTAKLIFDSEGLPNSITLEKNQNALLEYNSKLREFNTLEHVLLKEEEELEKLIPLAVKYIDAFKKGMNDEMNAFDNMKTWLKNEPQKLHNEIKKFVEQKRKIEEEKG